MPTTLPPWFGTVPWATREGDDQGDPAAPFVEIRPGELDAVTTALRRIWYQFTRDDQARASWERIMTVIGEAFQELEQGLGSVQECRWLSTAEGDVLDEIGALVDQQRGGLDDDLYRLAIRAKAASLITSGTIPQIVEIIVSLIGTGAELTEHYPATLSIAAPDIEPDVFLLLLQILGPMIPAGVGAWLSTWKTAPQRTAGWGSSTDPLGTEITEFGSWSSTTGPTSGFTFWSNGQGIV